MKNGVKKQIILILLFCYSPSLLAADKIHLFDLSSALKAYQSSAYFNEYIQLYFADQVYPEPEKRFWTRPTSLRKSKAGVVKKRGRDHIPSTEEITQQYHNDCNELIVQSLGEMNKIAKLAGANSIVNIISHYQDRSYHSETEYRCHQGSMITGVAFRDEYVKFYDE